MARKGKGVRTRQMNPFESREAAVRFAARKGLAGALPIEVTVEAVDGADGAPFLTGVEQPGWYLFFEPPATENPPDTGAASLGEYVSALRILKGDMPGDFDKARTTIHNTPIGRRREFAREIWKRRGAGRRSGMKLVEMLT